VPAIVAKRVLTSWLHSGKIPMMGLLSRNNLCGLIAGVLISVVLSACATAPPPPVERKKPPVADMSERVESLEKQLRERDKRIEELESQLEALKLIDQEHEKQRKPIRPPATLESTQ
jgi:TolA-binding protein